MSQSGTNKHSGSKHRMPVLGSADKVKWDNRLRFSLGEFSGSLGDLGLFIPLVVAMSVASDLDFGMILICAGLMNIVSGWIFRQPKQKAALSPRC